MGKGDRDSMSASVVTREDGTAMTGPRSRRRAQDELVVHLDSPELGGDQIVGALRRARSRGASIVSFAFSEEWLSSGRAFALDPLLNLHGGDQYVFPRVFGDTTPDRWGRTLLEREIIRREGRARTLDEWDLISLVRDETRMGALRFARPEDGVCVAAGPPAVPPVARLREIEDEVREVERGGIPGSAVADLVAPGSSLGGNRPKATFRPDDGGLWMAKFPSSSDRWDVGLWEYLLNGLAADAGISTPETRLLGPYLGAYHTFAARRFDRDGAGRRLFASALTLAGEHDHPDAASYLDIAHAVELYSDPAAIPGDLEQLFRRVVFNVMVGHRDDHLRNHGFLRTNAGWRLSPAYDLNPRPDKLLHELSLNEDDKQPSLDQALATAAYYRLSPARAAAIADEVSRALAHWRDRAVELGIVPAEIDLMGAAFRV
jgi:serine/threonine-protein kinase HipA